MDNSKVLGVAAACFLVLGCAVVGKAAEEDPPLTVSELQVTATIPRRLDLSWKGDEKTRPIYYYIHRSTTPGFTPDKDNLVTEVPSTRFLDWGLKYPVIPRLSGSPGPVGPEENMFSYMIEEATTYYYRVVAKDKDGNEGEPSNEAGCTTTVSPQLAPPEMLGAMDITGNEVWNLRDITINGTIHVQPGGSLTINACKVTFNNTAANKWGILLAAPTSTKAGAKLFIRNGSFMTAATEGLHWWVYTLQQYGGYTPLPLLQVENSRFSRMGTTEYQAPSMGPDYRNNGSGFRFYGGIAPETYFKGNEFFECYRAIWSMVGIPKVIDNTFHNFVWSGVGVYTRGQNILIENNRFRSIGFPIYTTSTDGVTIRDNTFDRATKYTIDLWANDKNAKVINNIIRDSWKCVVVNGPHENILVEGNTFTNSYGTLVGGAGSSLEINNSVVRNNVVDTVDEGYYTDSGSTYENNRVSNVGHGLNLTGSHSVFRGNSFLKTRRGGNYGIKNWRWGTDCKIIPTGGTHNLMVDTVISQFPYGLSLLYGENNIFRDLDVSGSSVVDIYLMGCNPGTKFINIKYSTVQINNNSTISMPPWNEAHQIVNFQSDDFLVYYYLDVKVIDSTGQPVPGAQVTVENVTVPGLPAMNILCETKTQFVTGADGHTPLPANEENSAVILGLKKTTSSQVNMTHRITASKDDRQKVVEGVIPASSWYRPDPNVPTCTITIVFDAEVKGRHVFYNRSAFDGDNPAANADDDGAVAPDKTALLPGGTATFANYTSYSRGINGIMIDIAGLPDTPTAADFIFKVGNDSTTGSWAVVTATPTITVREGAGIDGADRITIIWADNAIQKQWLQVTVKATDATGLASGDVFYFGNAIGETGDSAANAMVTPTDGVGARNNSHGPPNPAGIDDVYDFDRDKLVIPTDEILTRNNATNPITALKLIIVP